MIKNEKQYRATTRQVERFRQQLERLDEFDGARLGHDPAITILQRKALESEHLRLIAEVEEYERLRDEPETVLELNSGEDVGPSLIRARIARGWTQRDLAAALGLKEQQIQRYEAEDYASASLSRILQVLGALVSSVEIRFLIEREEQFPSIEVQLNRFPLKEIARRNWIEGATAPSRESVADYLWSAFRGQMQPALHRMQVRSSKPVDEFALIAWQARIIHRAREKCEKAFLPAFGWTSENTESIKKLSCQSDGLEHVSSLLWSAGIIFLVEPHLKGTYLDGASMLVDKVAPCVALTLRHDRLDNFWFTLMHEVGHLVLHRGRALEVGFFDEEEGSPQTELEREADSFALNSLISEEVWKSSIARFSQSADALKVFADRIGVHVSIVAGRIRHERRDYTLFPELVGSGQVRESLREG